MSTRVSKLSDAEFARQMARREIVFQRPTRWWQDGLTIGNGDLGGAVFGGGPETNGMVGITLSKVDVWDERYDRRGAQYRPLAEVRRLIAEHSGTEEGRKFLDTLEPGCIVADKNWVRESYPYAYEPPTPKPSGLVRIDLGAVLEPFEERLSIHRGEVTFTVGDRKKGATISTFVDADSNVLVVQVKRRGGYDRPITLEFARYVDEQLGEPEVSVEGTDFWHRYVFPDGFTYALYGIVAEGEVAKTGTGSGEFRDIEARTGWEIRNGRRGMKIWEVELHLPERKATLTLAPGVSSVTLYVGVATTKETRDPLARARELAQAAAGKGYNAIYAAHRAWWEVFWRKSSLVLSDRMVEALWYQGLYVLACQSRGTMPPSLVGPGYYHPHAGWRGIIHTDFNIQMMYWPTYASNHVDLGRVYYDFFFRHIGTMKEDTQAIYQIDGLKFPSLTDGTAKELAYIRCRTWMCVSAWCAQLYWWRYEYSQDREFLRNTAYPIMREVAKFYRAYAIKGEDGNYHIFPSTAPEQSPWWATDPAIDIALIRVHMQATIQASDLLGLDKDLRAGWRDLLDNLAPIPNNGEVFLDETTAAPDKKLGHTGLLCSVYTAGLIGLGSPEEEQAMARRNLAQLPTQTSRSVLDFPFNIPTWNDDCNWQTLIAYAARLGLPEDALQYTYDFGIFQHVKPNGLFAFDCPITEEQRETRWGMPDSSYAFNAVVSEMFLQSYEGMIRIAPAVPSRWDASLSGFLAVGAFEIDTEIRGGKAQWLAIRSLKGNRCRVVNPWVGQPVQVLRDGKAVPYAEKDGVIAFATEAGGVYEIGPRGKVQRAPMLGVSVVESGPTSYVGPAYMGNVSEEKRIALWVGLPPRA